MKTVFADSCYWIALLYPKDDLHERAMSVSRSLGPVKIVTTEMVFVEVLNLLGKYGDHLRLAGAKLVGETKANPNCQVILQTSIQFQRALDQYKKHEDKRWSLTDCASLRELGILEALSHDDEFKQAGFSVLL